MTLDTREQLARLVQQENIAVLPGSYDALSASILEDEGFEAVYVSGAGVSNTKLGLADLGLTTGTEMRDRILDIAGAIDVPILADADTGYGNPVNVWRTVQTYEQAGAAGIQLEDQRFPKQCGHFDDAAVVETEEMVQKVRAAVDSRSHDAFTIVARTDARSARNIDAAIERANAYADAGADLVFPEAPRTTDEMERFVREIDAPVMANMVEYGKTPLLDADELDDIGFDLVIYPNSLLRAAMVAMKETATHVKETGGTADIVDDIASFELRNELTEFDRLQALEDRFARSDGSDPEV